MTAVDSSSTHGNRGRAGLGVSVALISRIFGRLLGLVLVLVLARESSKETVALYGFLLGTITLMASVTDLGVASLAGRDVAARVFTAPQALRLALAPQTMSAVLAVGLTVAIALAAGPRGIDAGLLVPCGLFVVANALFNLWGEVLRGAGRVVLEAVLQGVGASLLVAIGCAAILQGAGITTLLWIVAGKELAILCIAGACAPPSLRVAAGPSFLDMVLRSAWLAVAGTAVVLLWRQGTLLISALSSTRELADYVVASRLLDATITITHTLGLGLFPTLVLWQTESGPTTRHKVGRYVLTVGLVSVVFGIVGALLAEPVTTGLFGDQWRTAVPAVRVFAFATPVIAVGYVLWFGLLAGGQERVLCIAACAGVLTAVISTYLILGSAAGSLAGAWGTALGAAVMTLVLLFRFLAGRSSGVTPPGDSPRSAPVPTVPRPSWPS